MLFDDDFKRFIAPGAERLVALAGMLAARGLSYTVIRTGMERHLAVRLGKNSPRLILAAHYDRVEGSPGVLDNSCACLQLVEFAARLSQRKVCPSLLIIFTDGEENPARMGAASQGSLGLAQAILKACHASTSMARIVPPPVLVFDVTGRGDRLLFSSASGELLAERGMSSSPQALELASMHTLARKAAARCNRALGTDIHNPAIQRFEPLSLSLPWSDDLGLVLGGLGALTISLLPNAEAISFIRGLSPETWKFLHTPQDSLDKAEQRAFLIMSSFLDAVAEELAAI